MKNRGFVWIGGGILLLALLMAIGAAQIKGAAGYAGAGPNFLPWVVSASMAILGLCLIAGALRDRVVPVEAPEFAPRWQAMAWVSLALLLNAALIEHVGFIASCAILFATAAHGFRVGADERPKPVMVLQDLVIGAAISAPVFWLFTKVLGVSLPALMGSGGWF